MIEAIFENADFIVCDKPPEVLSVPAREKADVRPCLGIELQRRLNTQVFPVHRLDYEVSGLIMFAKTSKAHKASQRWFEQKKLQKKYVALTLPQSFKHWPNEVKTDRSTIVAEPNLQFRWKTQILRGKKRSFESVQGDWAETNAQILEINEDKILWQLFPLTGKPHQLRLELSRRGFPIVGDELYGSDQEWMHKGIALRAIEIDFLQIQDRLGLPQKLQVKGWDT